MALALEPGDKVKRQGRDGRSKNGPFTQQHQQLLEAEIVCDPLQPLVEQVRQRTGEDQSKQPIGHQYVAVNFLCAGYLLGAVVG